MKRKILSVLVLLLPAPLFADLTIIQDVVVKSGGAEGAPQEMTFYIRGQNSRFEHGQGGMIHLGAEKKNIILMHEKKAFMVMPAFDAANLPQPQGAQAAKNMDDMTWEKTGKKEQIAGFEAEQWLGKSGGKKTVEVWAGGKASILEEFMASAGSIAKGPAAEIAKNLKKALGTSPQGYPLKTVVYDDDGNTVAATTVKKIEETPVDAKRFEIPAGYTEFKIPLGAGSPPGSGE